MVKHLLSKLCVRSRWGLSFPWRTPNGKYVCKKQEFPFFLSFLSHSTKPQSNIEEVDQGKSNAEEKSKTFSLQVWEKGPQFPDLIGEEKETLGFWKTETGLKIKDKSWTAVGRVLRMFITVERYDNAWETSTALMQMHVNKINKFDKAIYKQHGAEWSAGLLIFKLGGAVKLVTDDRWVDDARKLRTPEKKDFTIEAIDLRTSSINYLGMTRLHRLGYVRYLNFSDCPYFDNACMSRLHPVADTLEYLDISGTQVTVEGFTYFRIFPHLKWLNISRLKYHSTVQLLLPYLLEILPLGCVVVFNDERKSVSYGSPIPLRDPRNPVHDHEVSKASGIGDVVLFKERHGNDSLQLKDMSTVYELWQTPKFNIQRRLKIKVATPPKDSYLGNLAKYLKKAEKYPPIL